MQFHDLISDVLGTACLNRVAAVVIDRNVAALYARELSALIEHTPCIPVDATEEEKTLRGVERLLTFYQHNNLTRDSVVVAIGGGIIQDLAAFSTHVYYRGLSWIFIPTTLLSMADSCIGAKCGINFGAFKNQLGVFHAPADVLVCPAFTQTLSTRDVRSGYGEMLKLILTGSDDLYEDFATVFRRGMPSPGEALRFIRACLEVKKSVIEVDEFELDFRRILNYGHTFGHALESLTEYEIPHGSGVAWGMDLVNFIAWKSGLQSEKDFQRIHTFIAEQFPFTLSRQFDVNALIDATRRDKKVAAGKLNLVLLARPGALRIVPFEYDEALTNLVRDYMDRYNVLHWD